MKSSRRIAAIMLASAMAVSSLSISPVEAKTAKSGTPTCTKKLTVEQGSKKKIKVKKKKRMKIRKTTFKSSNKKIATVNKKGVVKGKKAGSCKVTVKVKYKYRNKVNTKKFKVKVKVKAKKKKPVPTQPSDITPAAPGATSVPDPTNSPQYDVNISINLISDNMKILSDDKASTEQKQQAAASVKQEMSSLLDNLKTIDTSGFTSEQLTAYESLVSKIQTLVGYLNTTSADKIDGAYVSGMYESILTLMKTVLGDSITIPTQKPTQKPTVEPTQKPTETPEPTVEPTVEPTQKPTETPEPVYPESFNVEKGILKKYTGTANDVEIPKGIVKIADSAFEGNVKIQTVEMPDNLEVIGKRAFKDCVNLESADCPESVYEIGERAFENCALMTEISVPNKDAVIGNGILNGCQNLTTSIIPAKAGCKHPNIMKFEERETCLEGGRLALICTDCGDVVISLSDATGHIESLDYKITKPATCTETGKKVKTCLACGIEIPGTQTDIEMIDHIPQKEWTVTENNCVADGKRVKYCRICDGVAEEEVIPSAGGHVTKEVVTKEATCSEEGSKDVVCTACNEIVESGINIPKKQHISTDGGTKDAHKKCGVCGETLDTEHRYTKTVVVEPTCTTKGTTKYTCHCGYSYTAQDIDMIDHDIIYAAKLCGTDSDRPWVRSECAMCGKIFDITHTGSTVTMPGKGWRFRYYGGYTADTGHWYSAKTNEGNIMLLTYDMRNPENCFDSISDTHMNENGLHTYFINTSDTTFGKNTILYVSRDVYDYQIQRSAGDYMKFGDLVNSYYKKYSYDITIRAVDIIYGPSDTIPE